jgi:hypothetical protein
MKDNHRVIIVFGMARSGTTVFTHVLGQHHKLHLFHNVYNYENDMIFNKKIEEMESVVSQFPSCQVVFKRPWSESMTDFFVEHMPDAHYLAMIKPFDMINKSWQKSHWTQGLWGDDDQVRRNKYDKHKSLLEEFPLKLKIIDYTKFVSQPDEVMAEVAGFLGLLNYRKVGPKFIPMFDTSMVKSGGDWSFMKK